MTAQTWEPLDYLKEYRERATTCEGVIDLLKGRAELESGGLWAHHLPRMIDQLDFFRYLLEEEIEAYGGWRYHGFQPDEVLDIVDEDLHELSEWIGRMTNTPAETPKL